LPSPYSSIQRSGSFGDLTAINAISWIYYSAVVCDVFSMRRKHKPEGVLHR
jgi:hypothetical protein